MKMAAIALISMNVMIHKLANMVLVSIPKGDTNANVQKVLNYRLLEMAV